MKITFTFIDRFPIEGSANIGEVLALSKEVLETEVKEETDIIDDETVWWLIIPNI